MPFVIAEPCVDVMDTACANVCPVDCIHYDQGVDDRSCRHAGAHAISESGEPPDGRRCRGRIRPQSDSMAMPVRVCSIG